MAQTHPMLPEISHDDRSQQDFAVALKGFLSFRVESALARRTSEIAKGEDHRETRKELAKDPLYQDWGAVQRASQELIWAYTGDCIDRQLDELDARAVIENPKGSLNLDPDFTAPRYISELDIHCMPGGYASSRDSVRQGALMDLGGVVYMRKFAGIMNDGRGKTALQHILDRWPDAAPKRILELGCGVGVSLPPIADAFPEAEIHAIDVGASLLRYAHARNEKLGYGIHFHEMSAEETGFEDESFDLVFTSALYHETSRTALPAIHKEAFRLLKPGGMFVNLDVSNQYAFKDQWGRIRMDYESTGNNEPFWVGFGNADLKVAIEDAGFTDITIGYQQTSLDPKPGAGKFAETPEGPFGCWMAWSGIKPA